MQAYFFLILGTIIQYKNAAVFQKRFDKIIFFLPLPPLLSFIFVSMLISFFKIFIKHGWGPMAHILFTNTVMGGGGKRRERDGYFLLLKRYNTLWLSNLSLYDQSGIGNILMKRGEGEVKLNVRGYMPLPPQVKHNVVAAVEETRMIPPSQKCLVVEKK